MVVQHFNFINCYMRLFFENQPINSFNLYAFLMVHFKLDPYQHTDISFQKHGEIVQEKPIHK